MNAERQEEKGSALLVTLMVMVGLSLLGLGFVSISETESAISVNERNYTQTLQVAEAGAKTVAEWFNKPEWALDNGLMPVNDAANEAAFKVAREVGTYNGVYRPEADGELLFDSPFTASSDDRLYGVDPDNADFTIDRTTAEGKAFLDQFNGSLFADGEQGGFVTRLAIYAPPIVGGTSAVGSNGVEVWQDGTRYGIATIAVTSQKFSPPDDPDDPNARVIAQRTVKLVLGEMPFPGADGPLQSSAGITVNGSMLVHWGRITSNDDLGLKSKGMHTAIPWPDAWAPAKTECGYGDDSVYPDCATAPDYLYELVGKSFEDPWFEARARGKLSWSGAFPAQTGTSNATCLDPLGCQPWTYTASDDEAEEGVSGFSSQFQDQNIDTFPYKREAVFNRPVYQFWKQVALTGATQQGIHYLRYKGGEWYDVAGDTRTFGEWVNVYEGGEEGFFFFDTLTAGNPQNADDTTNVSILTPEIKLTASSGVSGKFHMKGFFYLNAAELDISGVADNPGWYNLPYEPFRDVGFQEVNAANGNLRCYDAGDPTKKTIVDCDATNTEPYRTNITNYQWDYQDLNGNGQFDVHVGPGPASDVTVTDGASGTSTITANSIYLPVTYTPSCFTAGSPPVLNNCSEPHEPYLNLTGPWNNSGSGALETVAVDGNNLPHLHKVGWEDPANQTQVAKKTTTDTPYGAKVSCPGNTTVDQTQCTSNTYDKVGGLVYLHATKGPILDGIIYNEGAYHAAGNAIYYGSVLIWGLVDGQGTPDVYYDGSLKTGDWYERFENLPRTIITSIETDQ